MNSSRRQVLSEDPGEEPDESERNVGERSRINLGSSNSSLNSSTAFPPLYPCSEICSQCGKKVTEALLDDEQDETSEAILNCPCQCHLHAYIQPQKSAIPQMHIPPSGPNCLPGCGYSGLPCYNCGSSQNFSEPVDSSGRSGFPTQIYTVELVNTDLTNMGSQASSPYAEQRMIMERETDNEDSPEARMRRKTCISLVVFIITLNVAIAIFRMLGGGSMFYG